LKYSLLLTIGLISFTVVFPLGLWIYVTIIQNAHLNKYLEMGCWQAGNTKFTVDDWIRQDIIIIRNYEADNGYVICKR